LSLSFQGRPNGRGGLSQFLVGIFCDALSCLAVAGETLSLLLEPRQTGPRRPHCLKLKEALNPSRLYAIKERLHGIKALKAFTAP